MKLIVKGLIIAGFLTPVFAFAHDNNPPPPPPAVTITSVTLNGGTYGNGNGYLLVNPGDPITVTITADLTNKAKWKGTQWGINNAGLTPTCSNTKNKHAKEIDTGRGSSWYGGDSGDDDRGSSRYQDEHGDHEFDSDHETNNTYSVTFTIFAPKQNGVYNANFLPDGKNNCGSPAGPLFVLTQAIIVGINPTPPVIAPHDDILVTLANLAATGATVTYTNPVATSNIDGTDPVACLPASGSFFPLGNTIVTCMAHDSLGHVAMPVSFNVTVVLPPDLTPPVIAPHADIVLILPNSTDTSGVVTYTNPAATDDRDGTVGVTCLPVSGSVFTLGTTTVLCTAMDAATNVATSSFNVGVYAPAATVVVDTVPPVIAPHADVVVWLPNSTDTSGAVTYTNPTATDDVDGTDPVSCLPASGSTFNLGSTTVTCTSQDVAGNIATSTTFDVGVYAPAPTSVVLTPFTMASQGDESYECTPTWELCFTNLGTTATIDLGSGTNLQGALQSVTISTDPSSSYPSTANPWRVTILCFTDASYSTTCPDWVQGNMHNNNQTYYVFEDATTSVDVDSTHRHWTAYFTDPGNESNFSGSSPVTFNPSYYYRMTVDDGGLDGPAWGSQSLSQAYWVITGLH